jgi:hypothetical protein
MNKTLINFAGISGFDINTISTDHGWFNDKLYKIAKWFKDKLIEKNFYFFI